MTLDDRIKELIAVGASVTANCYKPCLEYHVAKARESGASEEEIEEAVNIAKEVRRISSGVLDKSARKLLEGTPPTAKA